MSAQDAVATARPAGGARDPGVLRRIAGEPGVGGLFLGAVCLAAMLVWVGGNAFRETLIMTSITYALVALGIYVPYVLSGSLSMAYSAYAAIGGYAVGVLADRSGWPLWLAWVVGPVTAAIVAVLLGIVTRRLSGFFLVAVTLLFGLAFSAFLRDASGITGGSGGIGQLRKLYIFAWEPSPYQLMVTVAVGVLLTAFLVDRARMSPWGLTVRTMREAPRAVEAAGVRVPTLNLVALGLGAAIAAVGGATFTYSVGSITPDTFKLDLVFLAIFMPLLGGAGTPWGAVLGGVVAVWLTLNFDIPGLEGLSGTLILAVAVLVVLIIAPKGIIGYLDQLRRLLLRLVLRKEG
jgi:branched-chain amino acid transport system permease protein